jgi:hypothetical protein
MLPSAVNDTMRDMMAQIRDVGDGVRDGTYTMTAPKITGGTITGVTLTGNTFSSPVISGGTINNATIGATTASTGAFTTLTSNGATTFTANTASTSTTTGTTVITGGLGVSGRINSANFDGIVGANTAAAGSFTTINASTSITNAGLTSGRVTFAGASGLLSDSSKLTFDTSNLTVGVTGLSANADGATGKLVLRKPNEASGNGQITRMLDFAPYYPGFDEAVVKASIFSGVDTGTQNGQLGFMTATGGVLSEKMRILANGNVGIGTSSPSGKLQIDSTNVDPSATATGITLINSTSSQATNNGGSISLGGVYTGSSITQFGYILGAKANSTDGNYAGYLSFGTRPNGDVSQERMRIDSSGNVGIGVAPSAWDTALGTRAIQLKGGSVLGYRDTNIILTQNAFFDGGFKYYASSIAAGYYGIGSGVHSWYNAASGTAGNAITFTQAMTLDASGNLYVGRTSDTQDAGISLVNNGFIRANRDGDVVMVVNRNTNDGAIVAFRRSGSTVGSIDVTTLLTTYNTTSDYRLKENIVPMTGALAKVAQLKPVTYKWKLNGSDGQGFIAHELQAVVPDCVTGAKDAIDKDGDPVYQGIDTSQLVATLVSAIQEQQALIESLTTRLTALESK